MLTAAQAKRRANEHLQVETPSLVAKSATRDKKYGVWIVSYVEAARPKDLLVGGGLVITDEGEVFNLGSAPGELDALMQAVGRMPSRDHLADAYEREGEGLALLADLDREEADGLAAWATERRPWPRVLDAETRKPYFRDLMRFVDRERAKHEVYPAQHEMFAAFKLTDPKKVKVVILGQDPYFQRGQANGLCFSVPRSVPIPTSLRSIHAAMLHDGIAPPTHGDLTAWGQRGVLLLNTALTVRSGSPNSHAKEWREFTDAVISNFNASKNPLVFVLWGREAQRKKRLIDTDRHEVIEAPHPAARGKARTEFQQSRTFSQVNDALERLGRKPINWSIPA